MDLLVKFDKVRYRSLPSIFDLDAFFGVEKRI